MEVVTVFTPRGEKTQWEPYVPMLRLQRDTAKRFGHTHLVVTDADLGTEFAQLRVTLAPGLMPSMIVGIIKRLLLATNAGKHCVFVDVDCLVARNLEAAFDEEGFDLILTRRENEACPVNNGAMYVHADGVKAAAIFFKAALGSCGEHWGADQEAISAAASPVPDEYGATESRHGCRIRFESMLTHAVVPKTAMKQHKKNDPFVIHFKGKQAKEWMYGYANSFILN